MSFSSCMFDEYPNLSPNIGGAEITLPGCKTMYRYGVAIPSTLLAQQSKVKTTHASSTHVPSMSIIANHRSNAREWHLNSIPIIGI